MATYTKPYLEISQQIALLQRRGMIIDDIPFAENALRRIGYYRLSAYWYPARKSHIIKEENGDLKTIVEDHYKKETYFKDVFDLYVFDKTLRLFFSDALERIEISLRTEIALQLGKKDPWAHLKPDFLDGTFTKKIDFNNKTKYQYWLERYNLSVQQSKEEFVKHFKNKYPNDNIPIWIAVELWDFGMLSNFFSGLKYDDKLEIAKHYDLKDPDVLASWLRTLNHTRNICAHHCRLWNKPLVDQPKLPKEGEKPRLEHLTTNSFYRTRIYCSAAILQYLMRYISPDNAWGKTLKTLVDNFPQNAYIKIQQAGFPDNWKTLDLWN